MLVKSVSSLLLLGHTTITVSLRILVHIHSLTLPSLGILSLILLRLLHPPRQLGIGPVGIKSLGSALVLVQILLMQERRLQRPSLWQLKYQSIPRKVNTAPMSLQHVQPKQEVHILIPQPLLRIHNGYTAGEVVSPNLQGRYVNSSQYLPGTNPNGRTLKPSIEQMEQLAPLRTGRTHDGALRAAIHKRLEGMAVDFGVNVEHQDSTHGLGILFHHLTVLRVDVALPSLIGKVLLGLNVVRVGTEPGRHLIFLTSRHGPLIRTLNATHHHILPPKSDTGFTCPGCLDLGCQIRVVIIELLD
mmetsp:Transcript_10155/g.20297  ORF Transcript_10155/g.20297 Transcript_10155/m.20297 type:complete len:301 (-) Transcript_10155:709-1611(-)